MGARKKSPPKKSPPKKSPRKKSPPKKSPPKKSPAQKVTRKKATPKKSASKETSARSTNPEFDSYVRRLTKCKSIEDLRKCSEGARRGDPFAWQKTFDVVLFGLSFKDESGRSIREAIRTWSHALVLDEKLPAEQHVQILGRLGLLPPSLLGTTGLTD